MNGTGSFAVFCEGWPPWDGSGLAGHVYGLLSDFPERPEIVACTQSARVPPPLRPSEWLKVSRGYVFLNLSGNPVVAPVHRFLRHVQLQHRLAYPTPKELAHYLRRIGSPRILIFIDSDHDSVVYASRLVERLPEIPSTLSMGCDVLWSTALYKNPWTRQLVRNSFSSLVKNSALRFTQTANLARHYSNIFGLEFGVSPHVVRDSTFNALQSSTRLPNGQDPPSVFLSGSIHPYDLPSLSLLARALPDVERKLGPVRVRVAGFATADQLVSLGFRKDRLQLLGWIPDEETLLREAARSSICFLPTEFDPGHPGLPFLLPSRLVDYIAAGVPTVAHAPRGSAVSTYYRDNELPFICTGLENAALASILLDALSLDTNARTTLSKKCATLVRERHLASNNMERLLGRGSSASTS